MHAVPSNDGHAILSAHPGLLAADVLRPLSHARVTVPPRLRLDRHPARGTLKYRLDTKQMPTVWLERFEHKRATTPCVRSGIQMQRRSG